MANDKIDGSFTGNKLNITISTNSAPQQQSIESTASKVQSISEVNQHQQTDTLNKQAVKKQVEPTLSKDTEILKSIEEKLISLNENVIKIQSLKFDSSNDKNEVNQGKPNENLFGRNFVEGVGQSLTEILNNSNFKTRLKIVLDDIYNGSSLMKASDIESFKADVQNSISSLSYNINDADKATNQNERIESLSESMKEVNQTLQDGNQAIEQNSAAQMEQLGDSIKSYAEIMKSSESLNTNTSDDQQNEANNYLKEIAENSAKESEIGQTEKESLDKKAAENDSIEKRGEMEALDGKASEKLESLGNESDVAR